MKRRPIPRYHKPKETNFQRVIRNKKLDEFEKQEENAVEEKEDK